ncbi:unnamed protein product [Symbiodinium sp. CCMP2592]|nr:unnamed protein product [Symbiodinium sp. CCMP2592]
MSGFSSFLGGEPDELSISGLDPEQGPESASEFSGEHRGIFDLLRDSSEHETRLEPLDEEANWYQSVADLSDEPEHLWTAEPSDLGEGLDTELPVPAEQPCEVCLPTLEPLPMLSPVRFQGPGSADPQLNAWQVDAVLFDVKRRRLSIPAQPWNSGPFALKMPGIGFATSFLNRARPSVGLADVLNPPLNSPLGVREPEPVLAWVVESRLRHFRVERSDEDLRVHALARIRTLVMLDPLASKLGRSLASDVENLATEEEISSSFSHAFASKAASTIHKRAGSLCKFASWCMREGASPLRFEEVHLYHYLCDLQKSAGATSGSHLIEALRFLDSVVSLVHIEVEEVMSARCRGVAQEMHMAKAPLRQKKALTRKQVEHLELFTTRASSRHACISGQLLWCMHSGSRWRDSQTLRHIELEVDEESGEVLIYGEALTSKTTLTAKAKTTLLPYVGVGLGVSGLPWAKAWFDARTAEGLTDVDPFLPTFCERKGCWGSQRMSASEASIYLREFLQSMDPSYGELRELGTHSMKRTLLSWAGKSHPVTFTHPERRLLGHHLDQENKSVVVYSKDAYVALYGKVLGMYATVRSGLFDPDMSAVMRMKSIAHQVGSLSLGSDEPTEDLQADRALFMYASEKLMGRLAAPAGQPKPLDDVIQELMHSPQVTQFLQPVQRPPDPPAGWDSNAWKGKGKKGKEGKDGKGKTGKGTGAAPSKPDIPEGCVSRDAANKPICYGFNRGTCRWKGKAGRCQRGLHICWKDPRTASLARAVPLSVQEQDFSTATVGGTRTFDDAEALAAEFFLIPKVAAKGADVHVDRHNLPGSLNAVIAITDFKQGGLVVEDPDGPERACFQGKVVHGRIIPFQNHVLVFDAQSQRHWTQAWQGRRQVLVAYSVPTQGLSAEDIQFLRDLGFSLPSATRVPRPVRDSRPWALEVFAGSAVLSKAWIRAGFRVLAIDICVRGAQVPIAPLDLTSASGLKIFWDLVAKLQPEAIHVGVPCGTASRAREKRLPASVVAAGAPEPQPLRDALNPLGLPSLSPGSLDALRVTKANQLYELSLDIALFCASRDIVVSIENPARPWAWAAIVELLRRRANASDCACFNRLQSVIFHSCMHGGSRPKQTKLLCTADVYATLSAQCDGRHQHEPWSITAKGGRWHFATAQEAAYPALLAARMARCLLLHVRAKRPAVRLEPTLSVLSSAAVSRQTRKHAALIPEFAQVIQLPISQVDKGMRVLREVSFHGECAGDCDSNNPIAEAQALQHPFDTHNPVAAVTVDAIDFLVNSSPQQVTLHRKLALLKLQLLIKKGEREEAELHSKMHPSVAKVMRGKKILALKALLEQEGYDDLEAVKFLTEGVHVMGSEPHPPCFDKKVKAATLTEQDLRDTAKERREAIVGDDAPGDAAKAQLLFKVTQEEVDLGFLDGPYTADEISNLVGHDQWCVIRRFLLDQGSKHRPIDDACQSQTNAAYSATIRLELHNADYVASLALLIAKKAKNQKHGSGAWLGKCLDLTKAYKQVALHPDQRDLCITYFRGPGGEEKFFLPNALMFGATAAVFGFIRISRCLWFLANKVMKVPSACYFDDCPLFAPEEGAQEADECISQFFTMLGWSHAVTGEKGKPCSSSFDVLGLTLDLSQLQKGLVVLRNKPGRVEKILSEFDKVSEPEAITRHQIQVLHGLLNFAAGFYSGRVLKHLCYDLLEFLEWRGPVAFQRLQKLSARVKHVLESMPPRVLSCNFACESILVWTDGSWESGHAGIGACIWDPLKQCGHVLGGVAPSWAIESWKEDFDARDGEPQLICHIELLVLVAVRWMFQDQFLNRRVIMFVDNDAARYAILKGGSGSDGMNNLVQLFDLPDLKFPSLYWIDRVPSSSNIADGPSRDDFALALKLMKATCVEAFAWHDELKTSVITRRKRKGV